MNNEIISYTFSQLVTSTQNKFANKDILSDIATRLQGDICVELIPNGTILTYYEYNRGYKQITINNDNVYCVVIKNVFDNEVSYFFTFYTSAYNDITGIYSIVNGIIINGTFTGLDIATSMSNTMTVSAANDYKCTIARLGDNRYVISLQTGFVYIGKNIINCRKSEVLSGIIIKNATIKSRYVGFVAIDNNNIIHSDYVDVISSYVPYIIPFTNSSIMDLVGCFSSTQNTSIMISQSPNSTSTVEPNVIINKVYFNCSISDSTKYIAKTVNGGGTYYLILPHSYVSLGSNEPILPAVFEFDEGYEPTSTI